MSDEESTGSSGSSGEWSLGRKIAATVVGFSALGAFIWLLMYLLPSGEATTAKKDAAETAAAAAEAAAIADEAKRVAAIAAAAAAEKKEDEQMAEEARKKAEAAAYAKRVADLAADAAAAAALAAAAAEKRRKEEAAAAAAAAEKKKKDDAAAAAAAATAAATALAADKAKAEATAAAEAARSDESAAAAKLASEKAAAAETAAAAADKAEDASAAAAAVSEASTAASAAAAASLAAAAATVTPPPVISPNPPVPSGAPVADETDKKAPTTLPTESGLPIVASEGKDFVGIACWDRFDKRPFWATHMTPDDVGGSSCYMDCACPANPTAEEKLGLLCSDPRKFLELKQVNTASYISKGYCDSSPNFMPLDVGEVYGAFKATLDGDLGTMVDKNGKTVQGLIFIPGEWKLGISAINEAGVEGPILSTLGAIVTKWPTVSKADQWMFAPPYTACSMVSGTRTLEGGALAMKTACAGIIELIRSQMPAATCTPWKRADGSPCQFLGAKGSCIAQTPLPYSTVQIQKGNPSAILKDYSGTLPYRYTVQIPRLNTMTKSTIRRNIVKRKVWLIGANEKKLIAEVPGNTEGTAQIYLDIPTENILQLDLNAVSNTECLKYPYMMSRPW